MKTIQYCMYGTVKHVVLDMYKRIVFSFLFKKENA